MKRPVYLSAPGLVSCAGTGPLALYNETLRAGTAAEPVKKRMVPLKDVVPARGPAFGPGAGLHCNAGDGFSGDSFPGAPSRLLGITAAALEQIRPWAAAAVDRFGPGRVGVCVGTCDNFSEWSLWAHAAWCAGGSFPPGYQLRFQGAAALAEYCALFLGVSGPILSFATACASSATAMARGAALIRSGICDAVIAGGADLVSETALLGFESLEAVSQEVTNPFSKNRKGINLGEGAAFFVLSAEPWEAFGGKGVLLLGSGESADAWHMTAPRPGGAGAVRAMRAALDQAGLEPGAVDYVNLHGTGTVLNDQMEAEAMKEVFGGEQPAASSTKPITGHTLGAAGALEAGLCWMALTEGRGFPVHRYDGMYDEELFPLLLSGGGGSGRRSARVCMTNSFAFGGCNVSLVLALQGTLL